MRRAWNESGSAVNSSHRHRRPRKIRRTGRHTRPSQVHNVAEAACKAAPAVAIAGTLIAAPQAYAAAKTPARTALAEQIYIGSTIPAANAANAGRVHTDALVIHHEQARHYTVRPGDTLSSIAQRSLSTYDPLGNANAAVIISDDGSDWTPWTTYTSGAYQGRC